MLREGCVHIHTCQPSWIIRASPGYGTDLPLPRTGHHIPRIKSSFELFCAFIAWDLAHFFFLFKSRFLRHFCTYLVTDHWQRLFLASKRSLRILIVCTSCKTSYNVLKHSHWGLSQFVGGLVKKKKKAPDFRSPEVGISSYTFPATYRAAQKTLLRYAQDASASGLKSLRLHHVILSRKKVSRIQITRGRSEYNITYNLVLWKKDIYYIKRKKPSLPGNLSMVQCH